MLCEFVNSDLALCITSSIYIATGQDMDTVVSRVNVIFFFGHYCTMIYIIFPFELCLRPKYSLKGSLI